MKTCRYTWFTLVFSLLMVTCLGQPYRGAELRSLDYLQYGRFSVSMKSAQGNGVLSTLFTYNDQYPASNWAEIDIEVLGRWPDNIDLNVIDENGSHLRQHPMDLNVHLDYHEYTFEWTPDYVAWFFDGEELYRQTQEHISDLTEPGKFMMNTWRPVYEDWTGVWDERVLPRFSYYEWASYAAYTPGEGNTGTDDNFTELWRDEFEVFDSTRWEKSDDHTWPGNNALLVEENIVYLDGKLILCLTMPGEEGFQDNTKPYLLWARAMGEDSVVVRFTEELDLNTAGMAGNYVISGVSVEAATLQEDQLTVGLSVSGLDLSANYTLFILGIKDDAVPPNTQLGNSVAIDMPQPLELPVRIDCAGPGRQGFMTDQWWSSAVEYGHEGGNYQEAGWFPNLEGTVHDSVMATSLNRFSRYHVRLDPGWFDIQLHFAEHFYDEAGERVFELFVEGDLIEPTLDIYGQVGNSGVYTVGLNNRRIRDGSLDILCAATIYGVGYGYAGPVLNAIEIDGNFIVDSDEQKLPDQFRFTGNYPNPFNASTTFHFSLPERSKVELSIYDLQGRVLETITSRKFDAGDHQLSWSAGLLPSGIYVSRFSAVGFNQTSKLIVIK